MTPMAPIWECQLVRYILLKRRLPEFVTAAASLGPAAMFILNDANYAE